MSFQDGAPMVLMGSGNLSIWPSNEVAPILYNVRSTTSAQDHGIFVMTRLSARKPQQEGQGHVFGCVCQTFSIASHRFDTGSSPLNSMLFQGHILAIKSACASA